MRRREFILASAAASLPLSSIARAQSSFRMVRVGMLWHAGSAEEEGEYFTSLILGFENRGYVEGRSLKLEHRYADEQYDRFEAQAAELAAIPVDVIMASVQSAALAAQRVTKTIPIVFVIAPDPVRAGLADSLARPGRNATGMSNMMIDLIPKRFEMLRDSIDGISKVAVLVNATDAGMMASAIEESRRAAAHLALDVIAVEGRRPNDLEGAFAAAAQRKVHAIVTAPDSMLYNERKRIAQLANKYRLPVMGFNVDMVTAGVHLAYGPNHAELFRRSAAVVDRILRGGKPGDIPIQQPTNLEFRINLRSAREAGIEIRQSVIERADVVIE